MKVVERKFPRANNIPPDIIDTYLTVAVALDGSAFVVRSPEQWRHVFEEEPNLESYTLTSNAGLPRGSVWDMECDLLFKPERGMLSGGLWYGIGKYTIKVKSLRCIA